ncbi:MAG: S41 family peptidase [Pseudomonadota bacterium]
MDEPLYKRDVTVASAAPLTAAQVIEDLSLAREVLETVHPGYDRYTPARTLDAAWDVRLADASEIEDTGALYLALSEVLTLIRCDHTKAETPREMERARTENASFFPFRLMTDGDAAIIYSTDEGSPFQKGDKLISIDGRPASQVISDVLSLIPVDGQTDHVKPVQFESTGEFLGSGFEHFYPLLYGDWEEATVTIARGGEQMDVVAQPITWEAWRAMPWPGNQYRPDFVDSVELDINQDGVAVLTVDTFVNYRRPVDPDTVYRPLFETLREENITSLILDTRENGGGSTDAMLGLLAYLIDEPTTLFQWKRVRTIDVTEYADYINVWDPRALKPDPSNFNRLDDGWFELKPQADPLSLQPFDPKEPQFEGDLIVLTSASNASGVALMLATLQEKGAATLVGEKTGGSAEGPTAGILYSLKLPNSGIVVRVPWQLQRSIVANPPLGKGVTPDVLIRPSINDRLDGRDRVLEEALRLASRREP